MSQTVIGIFATSSEAQEAKQALISSGFELSQIDVNHNVDTDTDRTTDGQQTDTGGRIGNFFSRLFDDEDESEKYTRAGGRGSIVTVHAISAEEAQDAADILDDCGAVDVNEFAGLNSDTDATYATGNTTYGTTGASYASVVDDNDDLTTRNTSYGSVVDDSDELTTTNAYRETVDSDLDADSIPVIEETLNVGKREVETGGVRLRSRIIERPVEETIRLREEHIDINRRPVNREATEADFANFKEGTIELTEHAEVSMVSKDARVVEEVSVNRSVEEKEEIIRDTVRRTEVTSEDVTDRSLDIDDDRENLTSRERDAW
jgi:uncharacterized protein (TIGR02271 family)